MGGSSGSKPKTGTKKDEPTGTIPGTSPLMTQPAFIGDNQSLLAQQLAAGGYGNVPDIMSMLSQTFTPMQVLDTRPGATPAPAPPATGGSGGTGSGSGGGYGGGPYGGGGGIGGRGIKPFANRFGIPTGRS